MTLTEVFAQWAQVKKRQVKASSYSNYMTIWYIHLKDYFGAMEVGSVTPVIIRKWVYDRLDAGELSPKYIRDMLIVLKMLVLYAGEELEQNVCSMEFKISWPTENKSGRSARLKRYSVEESKRVVSYILEYPSFTGLGVLLALCGGLRIGEIAALKWEDVDIVNKTISVSKTLERIYHVEADGTKNHTEIIIGNTKTTSGSRLVPLANNIFDLFKKFKAVVRPDYYVTTGSKKFTEPRHFSEKAALLLKEAGITEIKNFHALRHTFASLMIDSGANIKAVSTILGHADVSTTLDLYVHPSEEVKRKELNKAMGNIFQSNTRRTTARKQ